MEKINSIQIYRLSSPSMVSVANNVGITDLIYARVNEGKKEVDTHNCLNQKMGTYTIPVTGYYKVDMTMSNGQRFEQKSEVVHKRAGDILEVRMNWGDFKNGDWIFGLDHKVVGIYDNNAVKILDAEDPKLIGVRIPIDLYRIVKVPENSAYKSVAVLYGESCK